MSSEMIIEDDVSPADAELARSLLTSAPPEDAEKSGEQVVEDPNKDVKATEEEESKDEGGHKDSLKFTVKGEEKEYTREQLQHLLSREQTFQQKYEGLRNSDEYKQLLALRAAKEGDKGARKQILQQLKEMEDDLDSLDEVEDTFDADKKISQDSFEEAFEDVKGDVDYQETLDKINTDLKSRIPEKVFQTYYDAPDTRRTMYDLIKSGRTEEVFQGVEEALSQLSLGERVKAKADPEFYGMVVVEVINDLNARRSQTKEQTDTSESDALSAVSTGTSSRSQVKADNDEVDWMKLYQTDPEKFREMERKLIGRNI